MPEKVINGQVAEYVLNLDRWTANYSQMEISICSKIIRLYQTEIETCRYLSIYGILIHVFFCLLNQIFSWNVTLWNFYHNPNSSPSHSCWEATTWLTTTTSYPWSCEAEVSGLAPSCLCPSSSFSHCFDVNSVAIILHLLSLRWESLPAHLCLAFLTVSFMSFDPGCCQVQVLFFLSRKVIPSMILCSAGVERPCLASIIHHWQNIFIKELGWLT